MKFLLPRLNALSASLWLYKQIKLFLNAVENATKIKQAQQTKQAKAKIHLGKSNMFLL